MLTFFSDVDAYLNIYATEFTNCLSMQVLLGSGFFGDFSLAVQIII